MDATQQTRTKRPYTPRKLQKFACDWCDETFESRSCTARFCTTSCRDKARYQRDREKRLAAEREYRRVNAEYVRRRARERAAANPEKMALQRRATYLRHREKRIAEAIAYQKENPEVVALTRNRRRAAVRFEVTRRDHRRLLHRYRNRCAYCSVQLEAWGRRHPNSLQWDHVVPLARGGTDGVGNLLPACRECNRSKSARLLIAWRAYK